MTIAPTKPILVTIAFTALALGGFTLAHRSPAAPIYHGSTSTSAEITPSLSSMGVVENPPLDITVNGTEVPLKNGTTTVPAGDGAATVTVNGNSASVNASSGNSSSSTSTPSGNLNVTIQSSGNNSHTSSNVYQFSSSSSSTHASSSSNVSVFGNGTGHIEVNTH